MSCIFLDFAEHVSSCIHMYPTQIVFRCIKNSTVINEDFKQCLSSQEIVKLTNLHPKDVMRNLSILLEDRFIQCSLTTIGTRKIHVYGINVYSFINTTYSKLCCIHDKIARKTNNTLFCQNCSTNYEISSCINADFETRCPTNPNHILSETNNLGKEIDIVVDLLSTLQSLQSYGWNWTVLKNLPKNSVVVKDDGSFENQLKSIECTFKNTQTLSNAYKPRKKMEKDTIIQVKQLFYKPLFTCEKPKFTYSCNLNRSNVGDVSAS